MLFRPYRPKPLRHPSQLPISSGLHDRRSLPIGSYIKPSSVSILKNHLKTYPTPVNLSYFWNFGSLAGIALVLQMISGIFLAMYYQPSVEFAFVSVEHIMRDVNYGWFIRYLHSNGAGFFFIVVYLHIARGLYYRSFEKENVWLWVTGIIIFIAMMATAFIGYVLPFGQMSLWGATVITNLFSAIPYIGQDIVYFIWGGFSVNDATLNRFFSLHFLLPFIIAALVIIHLYFLHTVGSSNPFPLEHRKIIVQKINFYPYFFVKDGLGFLIYCWLLMVFISYMPNYLGHSDNYIEANPLVTPEHIVPEFYFLPFYAILRSIPNKLGGIIAMFSAILIVLFLPFINLFLTKVNISLSKKHIHHQSTVEKVSVNQTNNFVYIYVFKDSKTLFWLFVAVFLLLGVIGGKPVEEPYATVGLILTVLYFILVLLFPILPFIERFFFQSESHQPVDHNTSKPSDQSQSF